MFWRKAEVEIVPERAVYVAGEPVNVRARIWGQGALEIQEARIELRLSQRYSYERYERDSDGRGRWSRERTVEHTAEVIERLSGPTTLQEDQFIERYVTLQLPASAPPTGSTSLLDTGWSVQLILDRRRAIDISGSAAITVLAPAAQASGRIATTPRSDSAAVCAVLPQVETRDLHAGSAYQGAVSVLVRQQAEARGIRIELVRVETSVSPHRTDPTRDCHDTTTVVSQSIAAGGTLPVGTPWIFPFTMQLPPDLHPTAFTSKGTVHWLLRGVIDRSFASDYTGEIEVNVYNGPPATPPEQPPAMPEDAADSAVATASDLVLRGVTGGPLAGQEWSLTDAPLTLGRAAGNTIVVPDPLVSRRHAAIERADDGTLVLRDLGSTGGTFVNGARLDATHPLRPGDLIGLGQDAAFAIERRDPIA
jgi:hypothetical protein